MTQISAETLERTQKALEHESPRGMIMLVLSWIDLMLELKLAAEFAYGRKKVRESLYDCGGAFHGLSAKIKVAHCAGWVDDELFDDLNVLRKIRNDFAHQLVQCSPDAEEIRRQLESLRTPSRIYSDWGEIRAAEVENGLVIYSGDKPEEAQDELRLPGLFALKIGIPAVIGVLADALQIEIEGAEDDADTSGRNGSQQQHATDG